MCSTGRALSIVRRQCQPQRLIHVPHSPPAIIGDRDMHTNHSDTGEQTACYEFYFLPWSEPPQTITAARSAPSDMERLTGGLQCSRSPGTLLGGEKLSWRMPQCMSIPGGQQHCKRCRWMDDSQPSQLALSGVYDMFEYFCGLTGCRLQVPQTVNRTQLFSCRRSRLRIKAQSYPLPL